MSAARATSVPVDPDLVRTMDELSRVVARLPQIEEQLALEVVQNSPRQFGHLVSVRTNLMDVIAGRAKSLNMKGGTLRLLIELANEHRTRTRRRIPLDHLLRQSRTLLTAMKNTSRQTEADLAIAAKRHASATNAVTYATDGIAYLEASFG